jgi:hypothetical protein
MQSSDLSEEQACPLKNKLQPMLGYLVIEDLPDTEVNAILHATC